VLAPALLQVHQIDAIIRSQPTVKDIRLSIKAEFFGVEWANSNENDTERYEGTITKWKSKKDDEVYIRWEGWDGNKAARLDQLTGNDTSGEALECELLSYADGRVAPVYIAPAAGARLANRSAAAADRDDDDESEGDEAADTVVTTYNQSRDHGEQHLGSYLDT
jgi:hypothetical protein